MHCYIATQLQHAHPLQQRVLMLIHDSVISDCMAHVDQCQLSGQYGLMLAADASRC